MSNSVLVLFFAGIAFGYADTPPTYDPVSALYGTQYPWANVLVNWSSVFSVSNFDNDFNKTQAAALRAGGGVVYFPPGIYKFTTNIILESGIVIRGAGTNDSANDNGKPGKLSPKTVFECPDRQHRGIFNNDKNATNLGVVNIDLDNCAIMLWPKLSPKPVSFKDYWFHATTVEGSGKGKLVLGVRSTNVNLGNPDPTENYNSDAISWPWRFSTAISVYADSDVLVANNLIAKATRKATTSVAGFSNVPYPYDNRYGIDVNQILYGGVLGHTSGGPCKATPQNSPFYFSQSLSIRDNYVFMNGRVGISWSGGGDGKTVGSGTEIYHNHVEVASGTTCYSVNGVHPATGHDTNENRGFNQEGYGSNVTANTGHINRQKTNSSYLTVDGEGILHQCAAGTDAYRNLWDHNDMRGGESGYMMYYKLTHVVDNILTNNKVNSNEHIGTIDNSGDVVKGNHCSGNSPKCVGF